MDIRYRVIATLLRNARRLMNQENIVLHRFVPPAFTRACAAGRLSFIYGLAIPASDRFTHSDVSIIGQSPIPQSRTMGAQEQG